MKRFGWLAVLLAALLPIAVWLRSGDEESRAAAPSVATPDVAIGGATIDQFDATGALEYRLVAKTIRHFEADDSTQLDTPVLELHDAPQPPWLVRSKTGEIRYRTDDAGKREEVVLLRDDVELEQRQDPQFTKLTTPAIDVFPARKFAETDQPVMIDSNTGRTNAIGLSGDLNTDLFKLSYNAKHRVDTTILPGQFSNAVAHPPKS